MSRAEGLGPWNGMGCRIGTKEPGTPMLKRKRRFVRPDLQLRFILLALVIASCILFVNFQMSYQALLDSAIPFAANVTVRPVLEGIRVSIIWRFLISVGLAIPLAVSAGILFSFPFAGPCYKFKKYFTELAAGRWDVPCRLRKKDELMDIADAINVGLDSIRSFLKDNRKILADVEALLAKEGLKAAVGSEDEVLSLRARLAEALAAYERRLPATSDPAALSPRGPGAGEVASRAMSPESEKEPQSSLQA